MLLATVSTVLVMGPKPGNATSHLTAVLAIHDCVSHTDCIRADTEKSSTAKLTPDTITTVAAVVAALRGSDAVITGAGRTTLG